MKDELVDPWRAYALQDDAPVLVVGSLLRVQPSWPASCVVRCAVVTMLLASLVVDVLFKLGGPQGEREDGIYLSAPGRTCQLSSTGWRSSRQLASRRTVVTAR